MTRSKMFYIDVDVFGIGSVNLMALNTDHPLPAVKQSMRVVRQLANKLPHSSGIDYDWTIEQTGQNAFTAKNAYHMMDDNGMYCGIVDFTVTVDMAEKTVGIELDQTAIDAINQEYLDGRKEQTDECDCYNCQDGEPVEHCEFLFSIDADSHNDYLNGTIHFSLFG